MTNVISESTGSESNSKTAPDYTGEDLDNDYILVWSNTDKTVGEKYIDKVLKCDRFNRKTGDTSTGIIWICHTIRDKSDERSDDEYDDENDDDNDEKGIDNNGKKKKQKRNWLTSFEGVNFDSKKKSRPARKLLRRTAPATLPEAHYMKLNIFDYRKIKPLEKLGNRLVSAILFSDSEAVDSQLPVAIGLLNDMFKDIMIAAEYNHPKYKNLYRDAGADELFSREALWEHVLALSIQNCKASVKKETEVLNDVASQFLAQLSKKEVKPSLGMKSAYLRTMQPNIEEGENLHFNRNNWPHFRKKCSDKSLIPLAFFISSSRIYVSRLTSLDLNQEVLLSPGDSILFLTPNKNQLTEFRNELAQEKIFS